MKNTQDSLRDTAEQQINRLIANWPSSRPPDGWRQEMIRGMLAAADTPADIKRGVTKTIDTVTGKYVPETAVIVREIARQRIARIDREQEQERARRRQTGTYPREDWRGWLAIGAHYASWLDRGQPLNVPEHIRPYYDLCVDLGYRNHHGCGEYRDADGHLHPADPDHDPALSAAALEGAERIWRAGGRLPAPTGAFRVAA